MPTLRNPRRERFAQLLASGKSATDAYELAGYKRNSSNGSAMARTPEIKDRAMEINAEAFEQQRVTAAAAAERCVICAGQGGGPDGRCCCCPEGDRRSFRRARLRPFPVDVAGGLAA